MLPVPGVASWTEFYISNVSSCVEECGQPSQPGQNYLGWEGGGGGGTTFNTAVRSSHLPCLPSLSLPARTFQQTQSSDNFLLIRREKFSPSHEICSIHSGGAHCSVLGAGREPASGSERWGLYLSRDRTSLQWSSQTPPPAPRTIKRTAEEQSLSLSHKQSLGEVVSEQTKENVSTTPYWNLLESVRIVLT